ncbi:MAG TPA: hypothetical protein VK956_19775, partial [Verrucomicrobium sp.]|nr:hypothetical protein [Verrucomicrobium sp.]
RSGNHERTIREIRVSKDGIFLGEPLKGLQGVLTGVPAFVNDPPSRGEGAHDHPLGGLDPLES